MPRFQNSTSAPVTLERVLTGASGAISETRDWRRRQRVTLRLGLPNALLTRPAVRLTSP
ncbi:uncharacterized protein CMC5_000430 [Chondromyces crocatus]|uniref:Uncharacterized protein n=1 Tax=Chondromyces crocatus TaxID=52 RepID=A0A0K1E4X2_CHOCO|nr:uncharacterized protein CMC5_000430 [Chondromyces crocatus]